MNNEQRGKDEAIMSFAIALSLNEESGILAREY